MFDWNAYLTALGCTMAVGIAAWCYSLWRRDVSIVDSLWSLMILASLVVSLLASGTAHPRGMIVTLMVSIWAVRLSAHITVRNHGMPEDRRYQAIRQNNQPRFWLKSLYIVFGLQAFLAWVVSLPAVAAAYSPAPLSWLDLAAVAVWAAGMYFEVVGDWQLMQFQRNRNNRESVLNHGLWRYTRHPNYFGEALLWWGIYLAALAAGAWWAFIAPLLMTVLLLRVSGVALLEKDISERRPAYRDYIERTNAFLPGPPKAGRRPADSLTGA
jgi:steroid 5-alpha reductase family enzyme